MSQLLYIYGIIRWSSDLELPLIKEGELAAIFEKVPAAEFAEEALAANIKNMDWIGQKAVHHQRVLEDAALHTTIVPLKFGSIFKTEETVKAMLKEKQGAFLRLLDQLNGREEWGLKLNYDSKELVQWVDEHSDDIAPFHQEMSKSSAGTAFLLRKKKEEAIKKVVKQELNDCRKRVYNGIAAAHAELKKNPELEGKLLGAGLANILNLAILATKNQREQIAAFVEGISAEMRQKGMQLELTGPWPPYNFVEL